MKREEGCSCQKSGEIQCGGDSWIRQMSGEILCGVTLGFVGNVFDYDGSDQSVVFQFWFYVNLCFLTFLHLYVYVNKEKKERKEK